MTICDENFDATGAANIDDLSPFGTYTPDFLTSILLNLTRKTLFGRGSAKWHIRDILLHRAKNPIDSNMFGTRVRCYLHDNRCEWKVFLSPKRFDPLERRLIQQLMDRENGVFLDVGANIGMYSLAAAQNARADARIIAFEPHPITFRRLKFNLSLCPHPGLMSINAAIGDRDGEAHLTSGDLSLASVLGAADGIKVPMRPLVSVLSELDIDHVDVIKIDVEGYEDRVLNHFVSEASDKVMPELVIIEHLGKPVWERDCFAILGSRGLTPIGSYKNNTFFAKAGTRASRMKI